jgi:hypothetical protein
MEGTATSTGTVVPAAPPVIFSKIVNPDVLVAFQFFDRNDSGYCKQEDLEAMLLCVGQNLSIRQVRARHLSIIQRSLRRPAGVCHCQQARREWPSLLPKVVLGRLMARRSPGHVPSMHQVGNKKNFTFKHGIWRVYVLFCFPSE